MAKVLFITYDGLTDKLGQSQILPYLLELTKLGHEITILSCEKERNYAKNHVVIENQLLISGIDWHFIFYRKKPPVISTVLDIRSLHKVAHQLQKSKKFDLVHCRSYLPSLVGLSLKKKYGLKFIFDMRGFWADERVDGNLWNRNNPLFNQIYNYFKKKELEFIHAADSIISLTHKGKKEISNWKVNQECVHKISVIPCCVDTNHFDIGNFGPKDKEDDRSLIGLTNQDYVVLYLGSIGTWYLLAEMLQFFLHLKNEIKNSKFLFISPELDHRKIKDAALATGVNPKDLITLESERKDVPKYINICDLSVFFIKPSYSKMSSSPTKQGEIMAMGKPVICNSGIGDTDFIVEKYESGVLVKNFKEEAIKEAIQEFQKKQFFPDSIREGSLEYFSLLKGVDTYHSIYQKITSTNL